MRVNMTSNHETNAKIMFSDYKNVKNIHPFYRFVRHNFFNMAVPAILILKLLWTSQSFLRG